MLILAASCIAGVCAAQDSEPLPFARATLDASSRITVGEPVTLEVAVLVPSFFAGAPRFPDLDVRNALTLFNDQGTNFTEPVGRNTFAGQSRSYTIYPQTAGEFVIPELAVAVRYRGSDGMASADLKTRKLSFIAAVPAAAADWPYFIATTNLDLAQEFDPQPGTLSVGEVLRRTITTTIANAPAMIIPPLEPDPIEGLGIYESPAVVNDSDASRGALPVGTRTEIISYVVENAGEFTLSGISMRWWDTSRNEARTSELPAVVFSVTEAGPGEQELLFSPPEDPPGDATGTANAQSGLGDLLRNAGLPLFLATLAMVVAYWLARRFGPGIRQRIGRHSAKAVDSAADCRRRLLRAAEDGDATATWRWWTAWLDRNGAVPTPATIREFVAQTADLAMRAEATRLEHHLYGHQSGNAPWDGKALGSVVRRLGRTARKARPGSAPDVELNPQSPGR
jgi:hypothetical protein